MSETTNTPEIPQIPDIDKVIHEPARLSICSVLYVVTSADFTFVVRQTGLTWGNISAHVLKLEQAGYVEVTKEFIEKKPRTMLALTPAGRKAFDEYRKKMKQLFEDFA